MPIITIKTYDSSGELIKETSKEFIKESLKDLSMEELRVIGDELGVKDNKKSDLIQKIKDESKTYS